ncbi:DUF3616 domain-containing protein [Aquincola sp. MAHUQ-54]|uniref:DUF3616 domain-containing protein n=1 Tax=Aquincola agrisoli TaxID=3119538 RepID=A0AAW9QCF3_9BURK
MTRTRTHRLAARSAAALLTCAAGLAAAAGQAAATYQGLCDASAAEALDARHFAVAGDEDNTLRVFRRGEPKAVAQWPMAGFLGTGKKESDIEGAAVVGRRIYWIASHGRNKDGKPRPDRHRFFATDIVAPPASAASAPPSLVPAGAPYLGLLDDLLAAPGLQRFKLAEAARLAPEAPGGLNIEGLAARPGGGLWIGLRNPIPNGQALLVPLLNPDDVLAGRPARIGEPLLLGLRQRGVRSIERVGDVYWIVAGPTADRGAFSLYRWSGQPGDAPVLADGSALAGLRPEALFAWPDGRLQILSDDGGVETAGIACKDRPAAQQAFRSAELPPAAAR